MLRFTPFCKNAALAGLIYSLVSTIGGGRGYNNSVPGKVTKIVPSGDRTA